MIYKTLYRELCDEGGESVMRCIGLEMKKNLHWPYVLLSVAGIACLGFCGTVFDPSGTQTGYYSVFVRNTGSTAINVSGFYAVY